MDTGRIDNSFQSIIFSPEIEPYVLLGPTLVSASIPQVSVPTHHDHGLGGGGQVQPRQRADWARQEVREERERLLQCRLCRGNEWEDW